MSCPAPAPLSDLVTKDHLKATLTSELSRFGTEFRAELATQHKEDRSTMRNHFIAVMSVLVPGVLSLWLEMAGIIG